MRGLGEQDKAQWQFGTGDYVAAGCGVLLLIGMIAGVFGQIIG